jgi:hypothetical protein
MMTVHSVGISLKACMALSACCRRMMPTLQPDFYRLWVLFPFIPCLTRPRLTAAEKPSQKQGGGFNAELCNLTINRT